MLTEPKDIPYFIIVNDSMQVILHLGDPSYRCKEMIYTLHNMTQTYTASVSRLIIEFAVLHED